MDHTEARRLMASERYVLGELEGPQQDEFEAHYFDCRECARDVRLAVTFVDGARAVLRDEPPPRPSFGEKLWGIVRRWFWPAPAGLLMAAASLLLVVAYQGLSPRGGAPEADVAQPVSLHFLPVARSGASAQVALPEGHRFLGLTLSASWQQSPARYQVTLLGAGGAPRLSLAVPAPPGEGEELQLLLPARDLEPGDYTLVVGPEATPDSPRPGELARYPFTLERVPRTMR